MTIDSAININSAATLIAMHLDGLPGANPGHIDIIRSVTIAQMQTAKEVIEAHNEKSKPDKAGIRKCYVICADTLLVRVKEWADRHAA